MAKTQKKSWNSKGVEGKYSLGENGGNQKKS